MLCEMAAQNGTKWKQNVNRMEQNGNKMERQRLNSLGIRSEVVRLWGMAQKHKRGFPLWLLECISIPP